MKLTAEYIIKNNMSPVVVRVDGFETPYARAFDTEAGVVEVYILNDDGDFLTDHDGLPVTELIHGEVTFDYLDDLIEQKTGIEKPSTYGCHHVGATCGLCEASVKRWRLEHRGKL